jgi:hypothetical protein
MMRRKRIFRAIGWLAASLIEIPTVDYEAIDAHIAALAEQPAPPGTAGDGTETVSAESRVSSEQCASSVLSLHDEPRVTFKPSRMRGPSRSRPPAAPHVNGVGTPPPERAHRTTAPTAAQDLSPCAGSVFRWRTAGLDTARLRAWLENLKREAERRAG